MMKPNRNIYQVFVRNYSKKGTLQALEKDLTRIRLLGTDILYLMPIHEIGILERKGTMGSPYAIKDYFSISSDLGTLDDFKSLIKTAHRLNMRVVMDMVFNHTSPDNVLTKEHPEYYYYNENKKRYNRVGDWTDIVDLDTTRPDTQLYLLKVLKYWKDLGVDGYRFDVAPLVSLEFFKKARKALGKKVIFIAENTTDEFVKEMAKKGMKVTATKDLFPTFDAVYNYGYYKELIDYAKTGEYKPFIKKLENHLDSLPKGAIVINALDNHDNTRIAKILYKNPARFEELLKFMFFIKGWSFIYMGDEYGIEHLPKLFEKDPVDWNGKDKILFDIYTALLKEKSTSFNGNVVKTKFKYLDNGQVLVINVDKKNETQVRTFDFRK